mmetsp:Transcript_43430/g.85704  ORF Transcript_43430/g.85704 Transcript_43430/m.85704 type:complete len:105 (-) Transcript_43430:1214-1528(-)
MRKRKRERGEANADRGSCMRIFKAEPETVGHVWCRSSEKTKEKIKEKIEKENKKKGKPRREFICQRKHKPTIDSETFEDFHCFSFVSLFVYTCMPLTNVRPMLQ